MADVQVLGFAETKSAIARLTEQASLAEQTVNRVVSLVGSELPASWSGTASVAYQAMVSDWVSVYQKRVAGPLQQLIAALNAHLTEMQAVEAGNAR